MWKQKLALLWTSEVDQLWMEVSKPRMFDTRSYLLRCCQSWDQRPCNCKHGCRICLYQRGLILPIAMLSCRCYVCNEKRSLPNGSWDFQIFSPTTNRTVSLGSQLTLTKLLLILENTKKYKILTKYWRTEVYFESYWALYL